jgi:hypothetical protein
MTGDAPDVPPNKPVWLVVDPASVEASVSMRNAHGRARAVKTLREMIGRTLRRA